MASQPFTLRSAAGLTNTPPALADCTLLIIDAQCEYTDGSVALTDTDAAVQRTAELLEAARDVGAPVVHIVHQGKPGGLFDPDAGGCIIGAVQPQAGERVITKTLPNSFAHTNLAEHLQSVGGRPVVIAGFMTHMCVSATARAALDLGIETIVASNATATRSLPSANGGDPIDAATIHASALAELADRFSIVATTAEILAS
jgi:nicotinamidase-related amidase